MVKSINEPDTPSFDGDPPKTEPKADKSKDDHAKKNGDHHDDHDHGKKHKR